jgi:DNA-binding NtrC family response regulator
VGTIAAGSTSRVMSALPRGIRVLRERVLIVEEENETRGVMRDYLEDKGYEIATAPTSSVTEQIWRTARPDIAILDYTLSDGDAVGLVPRLKVIDPSIPIIILTGYGSIDLAAEAVKLGAELFLPKPADLSTLCALIQRTLENHRNRRQHLAEKTRNSRGTVDPFVGKSDTIRRLAELAHKAALSDTPALIQGEAGTGKGTMARWLHCNGARASEPFVDLNCGELPGELLESELFGGERNALGDALPSKAGLLEIAHRGTVFLDDIESVDFHVQPRLLKVVDDKQFRRLGEVCDRRVDIRLIAATRQVMAPVLLRKQFRGDLYDRMSWISLSVPPLRERV